MISAASASAVEIYLRPRLSAPARMLRALFSAPSKVSLAARLLSFIKRSAAAVAFASRPCADLIIDMAVSVARISNSSRLRPVMSRRERRSANCDSSSRMRSTGLAIGARSSSSRKPTQLRNFFSAIALHSHSSTVEVPRLEHLATFGKWRRRPLNTAKSRLRAQIHEIARGSRSTSHYVQAV